jgi:hypothetical protein
MREAMKLGIGLAFALWAAIASCPAVAQSNDETAKPLQGKAKSALQKYCTGAGKSADPLAPHVLFQMFLTSPPTGGKSPDWVLQSVTSTEFATCALCYAHAYTIAKSISQVPTINMVGWCLQKEDIAGRSRSDKQLSDDAATTPPLKFDFK